MSTNTKKSYRRVTGTIVPQEGRDPSGLSLLTPNGKLMPIVHNERFLQLKSLLWESVSILGKTVTRGHHEELEVLHFSYSESAAPQLEWLDEDESIPVQEVIDSIDYEAMFA